MTFEQYLISKKIDSALFYENEPHLFDAWKLQFDQMHPQSFTAQKLYLLNPTRRKYPWSGSSEATQPTTVSPNEQVAQPVKPVVKASKPVFRPKPKLQ